MVKDEFLRELSGLLSEEEISAYLEEMNRAPRRAFRVNTLKTDAHELRGLLDFEWTANPYSENSWYLPENIRPSSFTAYHAGLFYVQEPSAALAVSILKPEEHERVLDLCAAPGSKTTQILERLSPDGLLAANEYESSRTGALAENIEKYGAANTLILNADTKDVADAFPEFFDAVLCDAPCSGEGMFRKDDGAAAMWSMDNVMMCARRQSYILDQAYRTLQPGGVLVYSTCTLNTIENEGVISSFLSTHPDMHIDPVQREYPGMYRRGSLAGCVRILPNPLGEGHFVCRMVRDDDASFRPRKEKIRSAKTDRCAEEFLKTSLVRQYPYTYQNRDRVYVSSQPFYDCGKCRIIRYGIHAGDVIKGRFEPAHGLALSSLPYFKDRCSLSDDEVRAYLSGMQLDISVPKGWYAAEWHSHPLGLVRSDGRALKNKYPKRLRSRQE